MGMRKCFKRSLIIGLTSLTLLCVANPVQVDAASWKKSKTGWWWQEDNGTWPANQWKKIGGRWYYFNGSGYMTTGWQKVSGKWYYMNPSGAMTTGWQKVGGKWYYMNGSGAMTTGWQKVGGKWYYMNSSGAMTTGWQKVGGKWYYMESSGAMLGGGWHWIGGKCYYMYSSGAMAADTWIGNYYVNASGAWVQSYQPAHWIKSGNRWWYRHVDGSYTRNNWETIGGKKYHFDGAGWMQTGWIKLGNDWYYLDNSGAMKSNQWVGDYYVGSDGKMAVNQWIGDKYVDANGKWDKNKKPEHKHEWIDNEVEVKHSEEGHWDEVTTPAFDEEIIIKEAWIEYKEHAEEGYWGTEIIKESWDEPVYEFRLQTICSYCGYVFPSVDAGYAHIEDHAFNDGVAAGYHEDWREVQVDTIHHPAETRPKYYVTQEAYIEEIPHPAETKIIHHEAVTEKKWIVDKAEWIEKKIDGQKCSICGQIKK